MAKYGGSKQKKMAVRVDFTPMVDMNMLLICFFMLCTSLIKPQTMEINMPSNNKNIKEDQKNKVKASEAISILVDGDNKIYYFEGIPEDGKLIETAYGPEGVRQILLSRNQSAIVKVRALKKEYSMKKSSNSIKESEMDDELKKKIRVIKDAKGVPNVIIKASDKATYDNLISVLDEMQICSIGKYVIDKFTDDDAGMIEFLKNGNAAQ